jgi:hypothetical protein
MVLNSESENHIELANSYAGFEVLTEVVMKSIIFWDMTTRRHIPEDDTLHSKLID